MEFVERISADDAEQRWLVRDGDELRVMWVLQDHDTTWLTRSERDAASWIGFSHPRVSRIHRLARVDDHRLAVTVDDDRGPSFAAACAMLAGEPVDRERWAVAQLITIADGLAAMRGRDDAFVHRRLEPDKLFVDPTGRARLRAPVGLIPWGERNHVGAGRVTSTPQWMSPEQVKGHLASPASDVFSLASNFVYALTGEPPFARDSMMETLMAIMQDQPRPAPTHAPGLERVLERALAKHAHERYPDPSAFASALYECIPDAGDYDQVFSDRIAAWWPTAPDAFRGTADFEGPRCQLPWESLAGTGDVRHCDTCRQPVVRARSLTAVLPLIGRTCIAYKA